jgi:hypothetical protein
MNLDSIPGELDAIKARLSSVESLGREHNLRLSQVEAAQVVASTELAENTRLTRESSEVIKEVRDLMIAGRFLRRLLIFWAPFGAAVTAALVWFKDHAKP